MQANVIEILTAANALEVFETVKDRPIVRQDDFPAFVIQGRSWNPEAMNTALSHYNGAWEYQCIIFSAFDKSKVDDDDFSGDDYAANEALFTAFMNAFLGDGEWEIREMVDQDVYAPAGREMIGMAFTLAKYGEARYGN